MRTVKSGAARPMIQNTAKVTTNNGQMFTQFSEGKKGYTSYLITRPDPQKAQRRIQMNVGPNNVMYWFEMPRPPSSWGAQKCQHLPCD